MSTPQWIPVSKQEICGEKEFVPGVDPMLRSWARARQALRDCREAGLEFKSIPSKYYYRDADYWEKQVFEKHVSKLSIPLIEDDTGNDDAKKATQIPSALRLRHIDEKSDIKTLEQFISLVKSNKFSNREILLLAYYQRHFQFLEYALHVFFIDVNTMVDDKHRTLAHVACKNGHLERLKFLLENGLKVTRVDSRKVSPLHLCFQLPFYFHPPEIARLVIAHGANVNAADDRGSTPLHRACLLGELSYVDMLLKKNANVFVQDKNGKLPIELAGKKTDAILQIFQKNVRKSNKKQHERMWAYILSRQFVASIFDVCERACVTCRRKERDCAKLKKENYRMWLFTHHKNLL